MIAGRSRVPGMLAVVFGVCVISVAVTVCRRPACVPDDPFAAYGSGRFTEAFRLIATELNSKQITDSSRLESLFAMADDIVSQTPEIDVNELIKLYTCARNKQKRMGDFNRRMVAAMEIALRRFEKEQPFTITRGVELLDSVKHRPRSIEVYAHDREAMLNVLAILFARQAPSSRQAADWLFLSELSKRLVNHEASQELDDYRERCRTNSPSVVP